MHKFKNSSIIALCLFFSPSLLYANETAEINRMTKEKVNVVVALLNDKSLDKPTRNNRIIEEANTFFDFNLMSRLSLGKTWKTLNPVQRSEFTELFVKRIQQFYIEKLDIYTDEKVLLDDAKKIKKGRVQLKTYLLSKGDSYEIIFKFYKNKKRGWLVYDLDVEGVSVIQTYRTQFSAVLKKHKFDVLLEELKTPREQES